MRSPFLLFHITPSPTFVSEFSIHSHSSCTALVSLQFSVNWIQDKQVFTMIFFLKLVFFVCIRNKTLFIFQRRPWLQSFALGLERRKSQCRRDVDYAWIQNQCHQLGRRHGIAPGIGAWSSWHSSHGKTAKYDLCIKVFLMTCMGWLKTSSTATMGLGLTVAV